MELKTKTNIEFPVLLKLRADNSQEFRHQIVARIKRITSEKNEKEFSELLNQFRKEFISDFYFYIDYLNEALKNLLFKEDKLDHYLLFNHFIFLAQIGDSYTLELLKKVLPYFEKDASSHQRLTSELNSLEERVQKIEDQSENFKLYPMIEIIDTWID